MVSGPSPRYISNRVFNDVGQNLFSENDISQWGWAWGQFIDHDIGPA
jgi:peroxidase